MFKVDVGLQDVRHFHSAKSAVRHSEHQGPIAGAEERLGIATGEEFPEFVRVIRTDHCFRYFRSADICQGRAVNVAFAHFPSEKSLDHAIEAVDCDRLIRGLEFHEKSPDVVGFDGFKVGHAETGAKGSEPLEFVAVLSDSTGGERDGSAIEEKSGHLFL